MNEIIARENTAVISGAPELKEELYTRFISFLDVKPRTVETYTRALKQFAGWLSLKGIVSPTREDVISFRDELKVNHKPNTVQSYIIAVRLFFQWLEQEGLYPNIASHVKGATISKEHKKDYLTSSQIKAVLASIDTHTVQGKRDYAIVALMVTCGLRDIEVNRANIEDLGTAGDSTVLYVQGKGKDERSDYVKVPEATERAIREYLKARGSADSSEALFISLSNNSYGSRMSTRSISGLVKGYMVKAGYDSSRLTAHSLRHTAVTLALLGGNSLQEAQQFARHSNLATTQIYAHNLEKMANRCSNTVASAIF